MYLTLNGQNLVGALLQNNCLCSVDVFNLNFPTLFINLIENCLHRFCFDLFLLLALLLSTVYCIQFHIK